MVEIKVPELGESIQEVQISQWMKQPGEWVEKDEEFVELESEKASQALAAPAAGRLDNVLKQEGDFAEVGELIAVIDESAEKGDSGAASDQAGDGQATDAQAAGAQASGGESAATASSSSAASQAGGADSSSQSASSSVAVSDPPADRASWIMPAAERMLEEYKISADVVTPSGPGGRLLKEDVVAYIEKHGLQPGGQRTGSTSRQTSPASPGATASAGTASAATATAATAAAAGGQGSSRAPAEVPSATSGPVDRQETVKPMSMLRRTIAARLVEAQQTAALLTTFNEIDMQPVMELRSRYKEPFLKKHGVKLGFMSFFAKASVEALKRFPAINAEVRGTDVVYRNYHDIGIAIGGGKGLVVPILRDVNRMTFAEIESTIGDFAELAKANRLKPEDLEGGTFTISNGGVYGSLLSTPIVNPPQSGILGLHAIQERPMAVDGQVVIRPMMYVALTYDHRIVDGREAVSFLRTIKDVLEEPARLFLEV